MKYVITFLLMLTFTIVNGQEFIYNKKYNKYFFKTKGVKKSDQLKVDDYVRNYNGAWFIKNDGTWRIVNSDGSYYNDEVYSQIVDMRNGFYRVKTKSGYGVIDRSSLEQKMENIYDHIDYYDESKSVYSIDGVWKSRNEDTIDEIEEPLIFKFPDVPLIWKGCEDDNFNCSERRMLESIYGMVRYPAAARENGIQGEVEIEILIDETGKLETIERINTVGGGIDEEAMDVVKKSMNNWVPASQNGVPVKVKIKLFVKFRLE